ncbi:EamA family transporter [Virgibacillus sp. 6R]|uniref:DMT family transporter n=1 Tax=Metabacillus sp. 22489 TaxID=3453928 RepID=UPI0011A3E1A2
MNFVYYIFMCFIFGTTFLAIKIGVDAGMPPFLSAGLRFFLAGLIIASFLVLQKKASIRMLFAKEMVITGVCLTFGTFSTLYWAEQYVSSGIAAVLSATGPMMIILIQMIFLKEQSAKYSFIGCFIGLAGVMLLVFPTFSVEANITWCIGCLAIIFGEVFYASGTIYTKRVVQKYEATSPLALNAAQMMNGGILLLLLSIFTEEIKLDYVQPAAVGSLLYLIFVGSMLGHSFYYVLVSRTNPIFPSTWLYISPLIALGVGALLYGEEISIVSIIGAFLILAGTVLANKKMLLKLINKKMGVTG